MPNYVFLANYLSRDKESLGMSRPKNCVTNKDSHLYQVIDVIIITASYAMHQVSY